MAVACECYWLIGISYKPKSWVKVIVGDVYARLGLVNLVVHQPKSLMSINGKNNVIAIRLLAKSCPRPRVIYAAGYSLPT
jgi:hypothetical protein